MYNLVIGIALPAGQAALAFKEAELIQAEREKIRKAQKNWFESKTDTMLTIKDDYGNVLDINASNIATVLIQDNQANNERTNDSNIDVARANAKFLEKRNQDMELMRLFPMGANMPMVGRG